MQSEGLDKIPAAVYATVTPPAANCQPLFLSFVLNCQKIPETVAFNSFIFKGIFLVPFSSKMPILSSCWSPCFWHMSLLEGSIAVAYYTIYFPIVIIAYTAYVMAGGDSSQFYLPYFEADLTTTMQSGGAFVIFFCLMFILCSVLLIQGVRKEFRGLFLPWMICMTLVILFQAVYGLWIIIGYYILWNVFVAICNWLWMAANIYFFLCVWSQYKIITFIQARHIELLYV